ncbi:hypothetical protein [Acinetobacter baumannii]|uniref:hypothetical protein n=1 Tax=Acinetobacter baumannii TaxID=470 RepID=UPI0011289F95|nr:hypothetical protein [Acinetobacter baumannii]TPT11848.1 hypothetical protein FJU73_16405 [Acinetobacter baumannii]
MEVNFDLVIGSEDYTVDMQAGLETMHGVSDSTRLISEAILTNKVSTKKTHKSDIRTSLKKHLKALMDRFLVLKLIQKIQLEDLDK